jgi:hypothetical protein
MKIFLGTVNYLRDHIKDFSIITAPLHAMINPYDKKSKKELFCYLDVINPVCGTLFMDDFMRFSTLGRKFAYFVRGTASSNIIIHIFDKYGESERCKVVGISE